MLGIDRASPTDVAAWRKDKPFDLHGKTAGHGYRLGASACGIIDDRPGGRRACPGVMLKVPTRRPKHALPPPGLEALDRIPQIPYPVTARTAHLRRLLQQRGDESPFRIGAIACVAQPSSWLRRRSSSTLHPARMLKAAPSGVRRPNRHPRSHARTPRANSSSARAEVKHFPARWSRRGRPVYHLSHPSSLTGMGCRRPAD